MKLPPSSFTSNFRITKTAHQFNLLVFGILASFILSTWVGFGLFQVVPTIYYFRSHEFCLETGCVDGWQATEKGDLSRDFAILYQQGWPTRVTFDKFGFRSVPTCTTPPQILFWGDSYVRGAALSDDETLPWQVGRKANIAVYNAAGALLGDSLGASHLSDIKIVVGVHTERTVGGRAFDEPLEIREFNPPNMARTIGQAGLLKAAPNRWHPWFKAWHFISALPNDIDYLARNDLHVPRYLFERWTASEIEVDRMIEGIRRYSAYLKLKGYQYVFVPIPSKQTIYGKDEGLNPQPLTLHVIDILTSRLEQHGVRTINLMPLFESKKGTHQLFFSSDSHWQPYGVQITAEAIVEYLKTAGLLASLPNCQ